MAATRRRGFTLVEVLVALLVMSLLATMAWQGIDGMLRARDAAQRRLEATLRLNTALAQWQQDLLAMQPVIAVHVQRFDGASYRITRRTPTGMQVVVWALREGRWWRWAGPSVTLARELQDSWLRSQQLQGAEAGQVMVLDGVAQWQVQIFRGDDNAWSNAQSSGDEAPGGPGGKRDALPRGVRLQIVFAEGSGFVGGLTRDTALGID